MQLRNKLLIYFASFVMMTLLVFALSIYHFVQQIATDNDKDLVANLAKVRNEEFAREYGKIDSESELISRFKFFGSENNFVLLLDRNYSILNSDSNPDMHSAEVMHSLQEMRDSSQNSGLYNFEGKSFAWAKSDIASGKYMVAHVFRSAGDKQYQQKLVSRLIVVCIAIFWVGTWGALIISTVITRRINEQQKKIEFQASHDMMTGLQNRNYLAEKIDEVIAAGKVSSLSVFIIGLNRFREINNTLGHDFGDLLLIEISNRLKSDFWNNDTIARFGSDQYALIIPLSDHEHWKIVIDKIEKILHDPFTIQDMRITTDVSIGISVYPDHGDSAAKLLRCAEVAMYSAKRSGLFHEIYEIEKDPNNLDRLQLIGELNEAIDKNELELHFQPKVSIGNGGLIGCEALLRWNNKLRGRIPPDIFIPLAEQGSIIKNLTVWVLEHAIRHCATWHRSGNPITISVNLSARLLIEDSIIGIVKELLQKHDLQPSFLILEITESAMMVDPAKAKQILDGLFELGVHLSIDDFGTGYTSISQIQNLPVHEIKIDKSFILSMLKKGGNASLVKLIIDMGHGMGRYVTAEGIEDGDTLNHLERMGCDNAQGYFLGKPMAIDDFDRFRQKFKK